MCTYTFTRQVVKEITILILKGFTLNIVKNFQQLFFRDNHFVCFCSNILVAN